MSILQGADAEPQVAAALQILCGLDAEQENFDLSPRARRAVINIRRTTGKTKERADFMGHLKLISRTAYGL
jgi:hypothetical protein